MESFTALSPSFMPQRRESSALAYFSLNFEMFWHVYLFNLFILTGSDCNWQQCVELTLGSVLDLSVTITPKECEEKATRYMTIASGQEHGKRFLSPQKRKATSGFKFYFEICTGYCANDYWHASISFLPQACPRRWLTCTVAPKSGILNGLTFGICFLRLFIVLPVGL